MFIGLCNNSIAMLKMGIKTLKYKQNQEKCNNNVKIISNEVILYQYSIINP